MLITEWFPAPQTLATSSSPATITVAPPVPVRGIKTTLRNISGGDITVVTVAVAADGVTYGPERTLTTGLPLAAGGALELDVVDAVADPVATTTPSRYRFTITAASSGVAKLAWRGEAAVARSVQSLAVDGASEALDGTTGASGTGASGASGTGASGSTVATVTMGGSTAAEGTGATGAEGTGAVTGTTAAATVTRAETFAAPAAADVEVHAAIASDNAAPVTTGMTSPAIPRSLQVVFDALWDGGDITVIGTDQFDAAVTEVFADGAGTTVAGTKTLKTVTSISNEIVGAGGGLTATVQTGVRLGLSVAAASPGGVATCNGVIDVASVGATYSNVTFTLPPNGARHYFLIYAAAHTHAAGSLAGPSHTHTGPSHTHGATGLTATDGGHTHTGPSHTHTGPSHTHTVSGLS